jgi:DNA repair protein RecN (Recombination protein N)
LESVSRYGEGRYESVIEILDRIMADLNEASANVETFCDELEFDPRVQEAVEERLFALRSLARKHQMTADELPDLLVDYERRLNSLEKGGEELALLAKQEEEARLKYLESAQALSSARQKAAEKLDKAVKKELPPLKLNKADFKTEIECLPESLWNADGLDKVVFTASTNTGTPLAPIAKIASGGELARFMLALKVNLAAAEKIPTLVFDEVDSAIGGATASAVGERLARLAAQDCQVLTITHSPQVASFGAHHFRVQKSEKDGKVLTAVVELNDAERREEIARMLSGAEITDASRAAADELLKNRSDA